MSGIIGILNLDGSPVDRRQLERLTQSLVGRGPDRTSTWLSGPVGLGHTLLKTTVDSSPDDQPKNLGGRAWITADARIDERDVLMDHLDAHEGTRPCDVTDAELILKAYHTWGVDCVDYLLGDFVFAIWDQERERLFCARDHFGVKPFFYSKRGKTLLFSNTLNCLRAHPEVSRELNDLAVADFLIAGTNQDPETTSFAQIQRLPPAMSLVSMPSDAEIRTHRYWALEPKETLEYKRPGEYVEHFSALLRAAVKDRLRVDHLGVLMSGGLDSTSVAVTAHEVLSRESEGFELGGWTFVYNPLIPDEERDYAERVAKEVGFPIKLLQGGNYELYRGGAGTRYCPPEPTDAPLAASFFEQFSPDEDYPRVILTGQGGDPALLPSRAYLAQYAKTLRFDRIFSDIGRYWLTHGRRPPLYLRYLLSKTLRNGSEPTALPRWLSRDLVGRLRLQEVWMERDREGQPNEGARPEALANMSLPFWASLFECYDAGATSFMTELRHPYFDLRLLDFLLALPTVPWCIDKHILREAMRGRLPETVRRRRKSPLSGFPEYEKLREGSTNPTQIVTATPSLTRFVDVDRFLDIARYPERLRPSEYTLVTRPLSLAVWLQQQENRKTSGREEQTHEVQERQTREKGVPQA